MTLPLVHQHVPADQDIRAGHLPAAAFTGEVDAQGPPVAAETGHRSQRNPPPRPGQTLPGIASESVFVFGGSGGGSLALELAGEVKLAAIAAGEPANVLFTGVWNKETFDQLADIMADPLKYCDNERTRVFTRAKIDKIACPVLIVHSDVHDINKINNVFVIPMMKEAGKAPEICYIPGAQHGFYFGTSQRAKEAALKTFQAIEPFFRKFAHTPPKPIAAAELELRPVTDSADGSDDTPRAGRTRAGRAAAPPDPSGIDWDRVRALRERAWAGKTLTPDEKAYYERGVTKRGVLRRTPD